MSNQTLASAEISVGDWIQISVAVLALFGGGYAGAKRAALSRMHLEDRRRILAMASVLATASQPFRDLHLPRRESFSLEYASPLPLESRAIIPIDQVEFVMDLESEGRLSKLEEAEAKLQDLTSLLPLGDRLSYRRFLRATAPIRMLARSLQNGRYITSHITSDESQWVVSHGPGGDSGLTRFSEVSRNKNSGDWEIGSEIYMFGGPSLRYWRNYEYRVGPVNTSGGDFLADGVLLDWDSAWDDFATHLHRQLRPGRWRSLQDKLYRVGLLRDWLGRRL